MRNREGDIQHTNTQNSLCCWKKRRRIQRKKNENEQAIELLSKHYNRIHIVAQLTQPYRVRTQYTHNHLVLFCMVKIYKCMEMDRCQLCSKNFIDSSTFYPLLLTKTATNRIFFFISSNFFSNTNFNTDNFVYVQHIYDEYIVIQHIFIEMQ